MILNKKKEYINIVLFERNMKKTFLILSLINLVTTFEIGACTGISLKSKDGSVIIGRTVEWALSDATHDRIIVILRRKKFVALTPRGENGMKWVGKYGFISLMAYGQPFGPDGLNEHGRFYSALSFHSCSSLHS